MKYGLRDFMINDLKKEYRIFFMFFCRPRLFNFFYDKGFKNVIMSADFISIYL
jgi:hypothetical protein